MTPITIQCTTCRRNLRVVDAEAIGQILSCPKCGSMVLVEPPPGNSPAGYSSAVATESTTSSAVKMTATTVTESTQSLSSPAGRSVEEVNEAASSRAPASSGGTIGADIPTLVGAATQEMAMRAQAAPIVALAIAEEIGVEPPAAANLWPRWFLPGVLLTLAAGLLIFAVRMMAPSSEVRPANDSESETKVAQTAVAAATTQQATPDQTADAVAVPEKKAAEDAPQVESADKHASDDVFGPPPSPHAIDEQPANEPLSKIQPPPRKDTVILQSPVDLAHSEPPQRSAPESKKVPSPPEPTAPAAVAHARTLQRVPPRQVDVDARLIDPLAGIEVRGMPLWAYLDLLSELSSIPITLDAQAVIDLGQSAAAPVQVNLEQTTVAGALEAALDPLRLGYQARDGQLIVGYPPEENLRQVRYAVADLTDGNDRSLAELGSLVRRMVQPDSWQQAGGKASMAANGDALVVVQNDPAHLAILTFCEKLRVARDKPIKSKFDPARFVLATHLDKAHEMLNMPITANFGAPQPLSGVVNWLRDKTGVTFVVDHAALAAQGMSAESECAAVADGKPLGSVLDQLLAPSELAWRAIDEKSIEITTPQALAQRMDVEFYPVRDLATDTVAGHSLVQRVAASVDPKIWGADSTNAAIHYDIPAKSLVVRAPQNVQGQVEAFLNSQRKRK